MTRKIGLRVLKATIPNIKIKKTSLFANFSAIYGIGYVSTFVGYFIIRPDYNPSYSFRRNAFNEITSGLFVAALWPGLMIPMAHYYITEILEEGPGFKPQKKTIIYLYKEEEKKDSTTPDSNAYD
jgi:hypothetical protein